MKIRTTLILLVIAAVALAACSGGAAPAPSGGAAPAAGKPFQVAVVMPSAINDMAFSQSMYSALKSVQQQIG